MKSKTLRLGNDIFNFELAGKGKVYYKGKTRTTVRYLVKAKTKRGEGFFYLDIIPVRKKYIDVIIIQELNKNKKALIFEFDEPVKISELFNLIEKKGNTILKSFKRIQEIRIDAEKLLAAFQVFTLVFTFGLILWSMYKSSKIYVEEKSAISIEEKIDQALFKNASDEVLEEYASLVKAVEALVKKDNINGVLVYGPPGTGKTYIIRRTLYKLGVPRAYYKGGASDLLDFVKTLYDNRRGKVIVLDDFDSSLKDEDFINVLKAATDSYKQRVISVPQALSGSSQELAYSEIPQKFIFTSKIILITNKKKDELPLALRSRMYSVEVDFPNAKMIEIIEKSINTIKPEIPESVKLRVLDDLKKLNKSCANKDFRVDFRTFSMALDMYSIYQDQYLKYFKDIVC